MAGRFATHRAELTIIDSDGTVVLKLPRVAVNIRRGAAVAKVNGQIVAQMDPVDEVVDEGRRLTTVRGVGGVTWSVQRPKCNCGS